MSALEVETQTICQDCNTSFDFYVPFFQKRKYNRPKRCPRCAAFHRGRAIKVKKHSLLYEIKNVKVDIPKEIIQSDTILDNQTPPCRKLILRSREFPYSRGFLTIYDHRIPLQRSENWFQLANVRVMKAESIYAKKEYEYLVFDNSDSNCGEGILNVFCFDDVYCDKKTKEMSLDFFEERMIKFGFLWKKTGYSFGEGKTYIGSIHHWCLGIKQ